MKKTRQQVHPKLNKHPRPLTGQRVLLLKSTKLEFFNSLNMSHLTPEKLLHPLHLVRNITMLTGATQLLFAVVSAAGTINHPTTP